MSVSTDDVRRALRRISEKRDAEKHAYVIAALIYRSQLGLINRAKLDLAATKFENELQKMGYGK